MEKKKSGKQKGTPKLIIENPEGYTVNEIMREYKGLNISLVEVMACLDGIFKTGVFEPDDFVYLSENADYFYRRLKIERKDTYISPHDIYKNILEASFEEAVERAMLFFGISTDDWDDAAHNYRTLALKFADKGNRFDNTEYKLLIAHIDKLLLTLKALFNDYFENKSDFAHFYSFHKIQEKALEIEDLFKRKKFIHDTVISAKSFPLTFSSELTFNQEEIDTFIQQCNDYIEIIDMQIESDKILTPAPSKVEAVDSISETSPEHLSDIQFDWLSKKDCTLNRQFMAIYYIIYKLNPESTTRNKLQLARFIHFLTGKSKDNIYKLALKPVKDPEEKVSKNHQQNVSFVVKELRKLGLDEVATLIENDNLIS